MSDVSGTNGSAMVMRNDGDPSDVIIHDIILDSYFPSVTAPVIFSTNGSTVMSFSANAGFIQARNGATTGAMLLKNISFLNNAFTYDFEINGNSANIDRAQPTEITNLDKGTDININGGDNANDRGHLAIFQELDIQVYDNVANPIEGVLVYVPTVDS